MISISLERKLLPIHLGCFKKMNFPIDFALVLKSGSYMYSSSVVFKIVCNMNNNFIAPVRNYGRAGDRSIET